MSIQEKHASVKLSIAACVVAVGVSGWIWIAGAESPRRYHSNMHINKHNEYNAYLSCYDCHVPEGNLLGLRTAMTCTTSGCHGELMTDAEYVAAARRLLERWRQTGDRENFLDEEIDPHGAFTRAAESQLALWDLYPDTEERFVHHLELHQAFAGESCFSCHTEHRREPIRVPAGWQTYDEMLRSGEGTIGSTTREGWVSINGKRPGA